MLAERSLFLRFPVIAVGDIGAAACVGTIFLSAGVGARLGQRFALFGALFGLVFLCGGVTLLPVAQLLLLCWCFR